MSRVKNVIVSDTETFQEELIQELIKNQISYVQIENEFHFLDHIYRIYDLEIVAKMVINCVFSIDSYSLINIDKLEESLIFSNNYSFLETIKNDYSPSINLNMKSLDFCKDNYGSKINKKLIKQQNRQINKIINKK